jgi:membrane-associated phospholipid phosphatase
VDDVAGQSTDTGDSGADQYLRRTILDSRPGGPAQRWGLSLTGGRAWQFFVFMYLIAFAILTSLVTATGLLVTHVFEHGALGSWDHSVSLWFIDHGSNSWNFVTTCVTFAADTLTVAGIAVVVTLILLFRHWGRKAFILATSLAIELSVFITVNAIVARPRPSVRHLGGTPSTYSFPSGHTAAAIALYGGLAVVISASTTHRSLRVTAWIIAVLLAIVVGVSRIYRGEHYVTDVLAGAIVGIGALSSAVIMFRVVSARTSQNEKSGPPSDPPNAESVDRMPA